VGRTGHFISRTYNKTDGEENVVKTQGTRGGENGSGNRERESGFMKKPKSLQETDSCDNLPQSTPNQTCVWRRKKGKGTYEPDYRKTDVRD